jgi:hypothetical protein
MTGERQPSPACRRGDGEELRAAQIAELHEVDAEPGERVDERGRVRGRGEAQTR